MKKKITLIGVILVTFIFTFLFGSCSQAYIRKDAVTPHIVQQPRSLSVSNGDDFYLSVSATINDGGNLSCQWYSNNKRSYEGAFKIENAVSFSYKSMSIEAPKELYYFCVITNMNYNANGNRIAEVRSEIACIYVMSMKPINAKIPIISWQSPDMTVALGEHFFLSINAHSYDAGNLSYKWFSNSINSYEGAEEIYSGWNSSYNGIIQEKKDMYYFAIILNTNYYALDKKNSRDKK